jgi:hypothetical protein
MSPQETAYIDCPYCGERIELVIDCSVGNQEYVEDCQVCCRPISLYVILDEDGVPRVEARREDE